MADTDQVQVRVVAGPHLGAEVAGEHCAPRPDAGRGGFPSAARRAN